MRITFQVFLKRYLIWLANFWIVHNSGVLKTRSGSILTRGVERHINF
jgi:hypothetical protein